MHTRPVAVLLCCLLLGSCGSGSQLSSTDVVTRGFSDMRSMAATVVTDSVRREKFLRHSQALENELRSFEAYAAGTLDDYRNVFSDYNADAARLQAIAAAYREEQKMARDRFIAAHLGMASSVTAEEWRQLSKQESKIIEELMAVAARSLQ